MFIFLVVLAILVFFIPVLALFTGDLVHYDEGDQF